MWSVPNGDNSGGRRGSRRRRRGGCVTGHASVGEDLADEIQRRRAGKTLIIRVLGKFYIVSFDFTMHNSYPLAVNNSLWACIGNSLLIWVGFKLSKICNAREVSLDIKRINV